MGVRGERWGNGSKYSPISNLFLIGWCLTARKFIGLTADDGHCFILPQNVLLGGVLTCQFSDKRFDKKTPVADVKEDVARDVSQDGGVSVLRLVV